MQRLSLLVFLHFKAEKPELLRDLSSLTSQISLQVYLPSDQLQGRAVLMSIQEAEITVVVPTVALSCCVTRCRAAAPPGSVPTCCKATQAHPC